MLRLFAKQTVEMRVPRQSVPIHHYLKQPRRLVHALMNPAQVEEISQDTFRFHLRGFQFLMLKIQPVVDLRIDVSKDHFLTVQSVRCKIYGNDFVDRQFHLNLSGELRLKDRATVTDLNGDVNLAIAVALPPILKMTPHPILETTGNQILKGVLTTMKQRLLRQLAVDYKRWSQQQSTAASPNLKLDQKPA
ncbi:DUF1997 domain-containing protein [Oscillatoria sp. CS-180]|uniref:DUF1997 domain-containing protein n=1 Tax=Oscillatoria sp. CS-180 TaxID=3021720 RepID=UPI00232F6ABC|nr:DUF1997 domain-containing protein [Oscillatoria sp. CS-180]MDB9529172.1 DUF1997 domain-containing protein [Oscillatoria sp. CS-180]